MKIENPAIETYLENLPDDRKETFLKLRSIFHKKLPKGFEEAITYGHLGYVIPHSTYPKGYHCDPQQALPFVWIASQKSHIAIYHFGIYMHPEVYDWFVAEYPKHSKTKLDMGKSCIRFKKPDQIPYDLIAALATKITVKEMIENYENAFLKK